MSDGKSDTENLQSGQTVTFEVTAWVVCRYQSGHVKVRWESGEETILPFDVRL